MTVALELTELRVTEPERFQRAIAKADPFQRRGLPREPVVEIDVMGPDGMLGVLRAKDPFQTERNIRPRYVLGHIQYSWEGPAGDAWIDAGGTKD